MNTVHRAKIFSAFDALAGFDECIASKETLYCERRHLSESEREELDRKLSLLRRLTRGGKKAKKNRPQITVRYFSPCADKNSFAYGTGGTYETISGTCQQVDDIFKTITLGESRVILIEDIDDISGSFLQTTDHPAATL